MSVLTLATGTTTAPQGVVASARRPALDGVRALAVAAVMTYHLGADWLPGGFLGVDVFFVLSGFLITSILLDQATETGRIRYGDFFARRARRLLPALYLLLLAVCAWSAFIAMPRQIGDLRGAGLAALAYVANWFFMLTGQSYFDQMAGPSPLEHTWSLAIEEQFYLVWPLLLLFFVRRFSPRVTVTLLAIGTVASVGLMALTYDAGDPSVAYFGTLTRAHELLVGAILAIAVHRGLSVSPQWRWTGWLAIAALCCAFALVDDTGAFYYRGGSLVVCLVVAWLLLILGAGAPGGGPTRALSWRPIVALGIISYGVYLWHWPLILWLTPLATGLDGPSLDALRVGATLVIAIASYLAVERPIQRGSVFGYALTPRRLLVIVPILTVAMAGLIVAATARADQAGQQVRAPGMLTPASESGAPTVAIVGDSIPEEIMGQLGEEAARRGWNVVPLSFGGCPVTGAFQVDWDGSPLSFARRCSEDVPRAQRAALEQFRPDVVLWYSNRERYPIRVDGQVLESGSEQHAARLSRDLDRAYRRLTEWGASVVVVLPVPKAPSQGGTCAANPATMGCEGYPDYHDSFARLAASYRELADRYPGRVTLVSVDDLLCSPGPPCPALTRDGQYLRPDGVHFSEPAARWFVPLLFDRAGILA
ncbi:MAG: acyltransferase family protein [bacterium]